MNQSLPAVVFLSVLSVAFTAPVSMGGASFVVPGPETPPYLQFAGSPFSAVDFSSGYFHLEDFEDDQLNTPGATATGGVIIGVEDWGALVDSVDLDDGVLDDFGTTNGLGRSYFGEVFTFDFDVGVLGRWPTHAGVVWTDGPGPVTIEAFGPGGESLGSATGVAHADQSFAGTTAEDRFYGAIAAGGISRITLSAGGTQEADHLQYGFTTDLPPTVREQWRQQNFGTTSNSGAAADTADPDADGLVNLLEFACGLNPVTPSVVPVEMQRDGDALVFIYTRSKDAVRDGVLFAVEWTDDLRQNSWTAEQVVSAVLDETATTERIKATLPGGLGGRRFARLRVTGG